MKYTNPVIYADYSDPDAIRVGEDYYMIASSFTNTPALPILHSKDLVNWELIAYALDNIPDVSYDKPRHGCGVWAPSIRYYNNRFYIYFPMPDEGIFVTCAEDIRGPWSEPVCVIKASGFIDPCPFFDDDGSAYLVYGVAKSRIGYKSVLYMQRMTDDGMAVVGERVKIFDGGENGNDTTEGPKVYKRNGFYYILAPAGGVKPGWQLALRSRDIFGPYEFKVVLESKDTGINGPHQGALVDTVKGDWYFLHFRDVYSAGRIVYLEPAAFVDDWPVMGINGAPVAEYEAPDTGFVTEAYLPVSDDFKAGLGLQWQWNANHKDTFYEIDSEGLRLNCLKRTGEALFDEANILLQKWITNRMNVDFYFDLTHMKEGESLGIIHGSMNYLALEIKLCGDELEVWEIRGKQSFKNSIAYTDESKTLVKRIPKQDKLKMNYKVVEGTETEEIEGVNFNLEKAVLSIESHDISAKIDCIPGRWVGVKFGMYAHGDGGYALCERVENL